ncbi:MAG: 5-formyltetrahydrofolate cyclo-ligase [Chlamydiia bacterium]
MSSEKQQARHRLHDLAREASLLRRTGSRAHALERLHPLLVGEGPVLSFQSLPDEPDLTLFNQWLAEQGRLRLEPSHRPGHTVRLDPTLVYDPEEPLDVILVPGIGFTEAGHRLGRGHGHYDRLLSRLPCRLRIGICWTEQLTPTLPTDPWDQPVHLVITF